MPIGIRENLTFSVVDTEVLGQEDSLVLSDGYAEEWDVDREDLVGQTVYSRLRRKGLRRRCCGGSCGTCDLGQICDKGTCVDQGGVPDALNDCQGQPVLVGSFGENTTVNAFPSGTNFTDSINTSQGNGCEEGSNVPDSVVCFTPSNPCTINARLVNTGSGTLTIYERDQWLRTIAFELLRQQHRRCYRHRCVRRLSATRFPGVLFRQCHRRALVGQIRIRQSGCMRCAQVNSPEIKDL